MKWIGQHIWDFISRSRSTDYFENLETSSETNVLVVDSDGKVTKNSAAAGDITEVVAGDGLTGGGASGSVTVNVGVGTGLDVVADEVQLDLSEVINTDGANRILTSDGNGNLTAEPNFTFDGNFLSLTAFTSTLTNAVSSNIIVENTGNNVAGGTLDFKNTRASGVDGDKAGQVRFFANNDGGTQRQVGELLSAIPETAAGSEYGNVSFETLNSNGNLRHGLRITGVAGGNDKINVTLGHDSTSVTTISGTLTMGSTSFADNNGVVQVATQGTIDHDSLANFVANEHIDWTSASAGTIHATNYSNDNDDVSVANLKTRLGTGFASNAVSIGDSDDTVTIPGNLTVSGTTTTINTTDLNVEDKNITLNYHATNDTSGSADGAGITVQDAVSASTDASLTWDAAGDFWNFSHKVSLPNNSGIKRNNFWLNTDNNNQMTEIVGNANVSNKTINLPNIGGAVGVMDLTNSIYTLNGSELFPQAGIYTQVINMDMATVYALNSTAVDIVPDSKVHSSQTMMLLNAWAYVVTPNYTGGVGVANTANIYMQMGCTAAAGTYNKTKGFAGSFQRIAWNQPSNRTNVYRAMITTNGSSNYGNEEPGLGLKVWTNVDPSGSASSGSESISSIRLIVQYTIIPS